MPPPPSPVVVVPGITTSDLHDEYQLPPEAVWTMVRKRHYERVILHPEDRRYELVEPARVMPRGPFPLVYQELVEELRDGLSESTDGPVPVFPFGYDWRFPLDWTEQRLAGFIREVIDRTLLTKHYRDTEYAESPKVTLIGHSMGGLIVAGYIARHSADLVDKVVTLASPFQGSHEAILKVATGTSNLGDDSGKARERRMARLTPALYHLLPSFPGALAVDDGLNPDIFHPRAWQPNVAATVARQVDGWDVSGRDLFNQMLDEARAHRERITNLDLPERVALRVRADHNGRPRFDLRSRERQNLWGADRNRERPNTGDGTVPLAGAIPPFLGASRVVCVSPDDFGYWEVRDRALSAMAGLHGVLPKMNMLHRLILRFLLGTGDRYGNTWGRRVPGVERWEPPLVLHEKM